MALLLIMGVYYSWLASRRQWILRHVAMARIASYQLQTWGSRASCELLNIWWHVSCAPNGDLVSRSLLSHSVSRAPADFQPLSPQVSCLDPDLPQWHHPKISCEIGAFSTWMGLLQSSLTTPVLFMFPYSQEKRWQQICIFCQFINQGTHPCSFILS